MDKWVPSCFPMAACRCDEILLDIADDLVDYEDDVHGGTFNILRAYCHLYGPEKTRPIKW